jgi:mannose-6-phosphate isomerase-like protein (cupin superfamily)
MKPSILKHDSDSEFFIDEGCHISELSNSENDGSVSIAQARVKPGVTTRWHRLHGVIERYVILSGEGIVEIDDLPETLVQANDVVLIPSMCRQRIRNIGQQDLIFLAICSTRFTKTCYEDIEPPQL